MLFFTLSIYVNIFCIVGVVEILGSSCARENMNLLLVGNSGVQWLLAMIPASQANVSFALDPGKTAPHCTLHTQGTLGTLDTLHTLGTQDTPRTAHYCTATNCCQCCCPFLTSHTNGNKLLAFMATNSMYHQAPCIAEWSIGITT